MESKNQDNFLLAELIAGNPRAFDKIFRDHYTNLCRFVNSIIVDEDKAQSLVQNVFVRLWENRSGLSDVKSFQPYLTTMVKHEAINHIRHEKRFVRLDHLQEDSKANTPVEDYIIEKELSEKLIVAVGSLPDRCREAFELSRFENLSNREIADKMGITLKGVEALMTRSLKLLRVELREFLPSSRNKGSGMSLFFMIVAKKVLTLLKKQ